MKIGISFPQNGVGQDLIAIRDFAQAAEDLGYDYFFAGDHVLGEDPANFKGRPGPYTVDFIYHEPFALFAYVAAITTRIRLFSGIVILPQRQTVLVAKQAAEVDWLSNGRLSLGVGVGWNKLEYDALNEQFDNRGTRMVEQFDVMRTLWTQQLVTYHGRWHHIENCGLNPMPVQRPIPLWIGGTADSVLRRAARIADGWIVATDVGVPPTPENFRANWEKVRAYAAEAGRDPSTIGLHTGVGIPSDSDREDWTRELHVLREMGATHVTVSTRHLPNEPALHIAGMRRAKETLDALKVNG